MFGFEPPGDALANGAGAFGGFLGQGFGVGCCAAGLEGAGDAAGGFGGAAAAGEIHEALRKIGGGKTVWGEDFEGGGDLRAGGGERGVDVGEAGDDALDIAVDDDGALAKGEGGDGGGGIGAEAGEAAQRGLGDGEVATVILGDDAGAGEEISGAGIIAEAGPGLHDVFIGCRGEGLDAGPAAGEGDEIGLCGLHRGLLEHDFGEPDAVGPIGICGHWRAGGAAPGHGARVLCIPVEKLLADKWRECLGHGGFAMA